MMRRKLNTSFLIALLALFAWITFLIVEPFLDFVIGGLLLTFVFYPLYERILPKVRYPALASLLVIFVIVLIVVLPMFFAVWSLVQDVQNIADRFTVAKLEAAIAAFDARINEWLGVELLTPPNATADGNGTVDGTDAQNSIADPGGNNTTTDGDNTTADPAAGDPPPAEPTQGEPLFSSQQLIEFAVQRAEGVAGDLVASAFAFIVKAVLGVFVMVFIMYYGFKDGRKFIQFAYGALPLRDSYKSLLFQEIQEVVDAVFIGQILVSLAQGVLGGLGFWALGFPNPVFWGFIMTILAILPIIGTPVVWVPWALWALVTGDTFAGVGLLIYGTIIVSTVDNILKPKIIGDRAEIHPVIVLLGVVGGLAVFGFIGFLLGPLLLAIFTVLLKLFQADFVAREELNVPALGQGG